jgi:phage terminase large subunit
LARIRLPNNWRPRDYQLPLFSYLENGGKRAINIWHRRAGKDEVCLHWAATQMVERPATYWHMLPEYAQGRKAIWTAVNPHTGKRRIDEAFPKELRENTNEQEMFIRFKTGATWQVVGSDRYDSTVGSPPAGVTFSEWALANPAAWGYLAPIVVENNGWALFITTSRGRNHAKSMLDMARETPGWFSQVLTVDDTKAMSREAVEAQRREYHGIFGEDAGDALIEQEYFCSFEAAILGAYYGKEMVRAEREGRIRSVPVEPLLPVHTAWDLGIDDAMAIWCWQMVANEIRCVDYYEGHGHGLRHYADWLNERGYHGTDWVPHDAKVRELGTGRTRVEVMEEMGRKPRVIPLHNPMDGINAVRETLPRTYWDAKKCERGLECLRQYRTEWDEKTRSFKKTPLHDWASHGADAKRTLAMAWREMRAPTPPPSPPVHVFEATPSGGVKSNLTFRELVERQSRKRREDD